MNGRVPVVTAVKRGCSALGLFNLARVVDDVFGLVGILTRDAFQSERREVRCLFVG